jgi:hypothetical protein
MMRMNGKMKTTMMMMRDLKIKILSMNNQSLESSGFTLVLSNDDLMRTDYHSMMDTIIPSISLKQAINWMEILSLTIM